jgi:tetratricopeptide (TPR) repeat protein
MGDETTEMRALRSLALAYERVRNFSKAVDVFQQYADRLDQDADRAEIGRVHSSMGHSLRDLGRYSQAEACYAKNLQIVRGLRDLAAESAALGNLGNTLICRGQFERALEYHLEGLAIACRVSSNKLVECSARNNLACVYMRLGETQKALEHCTAALAVVESAIRTAQARTETADHPAACTMLAASIHGNQGLIFTALEKPRRALANYEDQHRLATNAGDAANRARALANMGNTYVALGSRYYEHAAGQHREYLEIVKADKDLVGLSAAYCNLGCVYAKMGEYLKAIDFMTKQRNAAVKLQDRRAECVALSNLGLMYNMMQKHDKALEHFTLLLELAKQLDDVKMQARAYGNLGETYHIVQDWSKAVICFEKRLQYARVGLDTEGSARSLSHLGALYHKVGQFRRAAACYESLVQLGAESKNAEIESAASLDLSRSYSRLGMYAKAEDARRHADSKAMSRLSPTRPVDPCGITV